MSRGRSGRRAGESAELIIGGGGRGRAGEDGFKGFSERVERDVMESILFLSINDYCYVMDL